VYTDNVVVVCDIDHEWTATAGIVPGDVEICEAVVAG
jgi:hypothetical protein